MGSEVERESLCEYSHLGLSMGWVGFGLDPTGSGYQNCNPQLTWYMGQTQWFRSSVNQVELVSLGFNLGWICDFA